ncbi:MAG: LysR family transcriptional regulator [Gammaproteobacteria bacterium]|nr:MAG: LysR family transcriptional regulator [Gammaproteobacteria bacterium]
MHLTLRQLKVFEAVARLRSYTRAAEELHLTQPAVSMQVRQLEEAAGLELFEQLGRRLYLTAAGEELYRCARAVARELEETEAALEELKGLRRGRLAVAVASTANSFATRLLGAFGQRHPGTTLRLDVTNRAGLLAHLAENDVDLVIMGRPPEGLDLEPVPFMENPLVVIAAPGHPLAGRGRVPLEALREETFVVREQGSGTRIAMERHFAQQGIRLRTGMEMSSNEAIKQAVQAGLGLGIVSVHTLEVELEAGRLVVLEVEGFPILRHWYVVHRRGKRLSPLAAAFKGFVLEEGARLAGRAAGSGAAPVAEAAGG